MANLSYVNYDFTDLVSQLSDRVKSSAAWRDAYRSGTGQMLMEFYGYVGNLILYYVERAVEEGFLETARNRSSVVNLVRLLGYVPKRAVSATGTVTFSIPTSHGSNIFIPKYTTVTSTGGLTYYVTQDAVILTGSTSISASIKQGLKVTQSTVSTGALNQEYTYQYTDVENTGVEVSVNGEVWTAVTSFTNGTPTSKWYIVREELDGKLTIVFGDNVSAKSPENGDSISTILIRSAGVSGNVYASGSITTVTSSVYDAAGVLVTNLSVTNSDVILGGDDAETADEIRYEAPRVFSTGDRAVTKDDYMAILDNYAGVASSNAWGENEETPPNYDMFNRVKICLILQNWVLPTTSFKATLSEYLYTKAQVTVKYTYVDPTIIYVIPVLTVKAVKGYTLSNVQSDVETALAGAFELGTTAKLGVSQRLGDLIATVEQVEGVSYHYMTLYVYKELTEAYDSLYQYSETMDCLTIKPSTVGLYVNDEKIAEDDGAGSFTALTSDYVVTSSSIDYSTGYIGADLSPSPQPTDTVSVRYEQNEDGDVVVEKNQIAKLQDTEITISYAS